jgi:hypothetical protein
MITPRTGLAAAALAVGAGAVVFLSTNSPQPGDIVPAAPPAAVQLPAIVEPVQLVPAAAPVAPSTTPAPKAVDTPSTPRPVAKPAGRAAPTPTKAQATPRRTAKAPTQAAPPAHSEMDLGNGWSAYCNNGYLQPDGSCSSRPEGYHPTPAADPCTGTGTECLNATLGELGIYNGIPGLMGGH